MPRQAHLNRTFDFPSSVAEEEVELEMVQPQAIAAHLEELPNSRATISQPSTAISSLADLSSTMNTPPCAQPDQRMIMGIATQESLELQPDLPEQRRTKRMKPIQFDSTGETVGGHINGSATTSFARMASTKNYALVESSLSTDTSSIIPATLREYTQLDTILSPAKNSTSAKHGSQQDDLAEDPSSPAARLASQQEVDMEAQAIPSSSPVDPTYRRTDENEVDILKDYDNVGMENAVADASRQVLDEPDCGLKRSAVTEAELLPFDVFISHYAEYTEGPNGTLWTFIRACVCLEFMRNANSLRDCLWDEFIHAFSDSYLSYIETTAEPLPALEWFNRLPGSMKFKDMVVTRSNLDLILSSYPDAVARAKNFTKRKDENTGRISKPALANAQTNQTSADRSSLSRKTSPITRDTQSSRPTPLRLSDVRSRVSAGSPLPSTAASDISVRSSSHSTTSTLSKSRGHKYINKLLSKGRKDAKIPLEQLQKHIEKRRSSLHVDGLAETVSRPA
jgi:hypothetical protein